MNKIKSSQTLADKIAGILNTAPSSFDPEDDNVDATKAQVVEHDEDTNLEEDILSKFRRKNIDLLADLDEKYAGKKTSRKQLADADSEDAFSSDNLEESDDGGNNENDDQKTVEEEMSTSEIDDEEESEGEEESEVEDFEETDTNIKHISDTNVPYQIKKGLCVRNQMLMWENLLEVRIQLQKCLIGANKMPQPDVFKEIKQTAPEFYNKVDETKHKLCDTLEKLLLLQKLLLKQFPETKNLGHQNQKQCGEDGMDDEEIESSDNEEEEEEVDDQIETKTQNKKRKLVQYEEEISEQHKKYKDYRNGVIQKWNDKTRVILKGGVTSHSVLNQIEYSLSNKEKLIKRTQLKRSQYTILGDKETPEDKTGEEYNTEIFDDDDFYHQLLRELIEVKSADVTDPVQLGRQWIQLQNLRSKMKRKIDTRATKGRKIRYAVHSKLVNFMAPIDDNLWTDEAKTELYSSLFGKNQPVCSV